MYTKYYPKSIEIWVAGAFIADHWKEKDKLDKDCLIKALLLHDMGNIIRV